MAITKLESSRDFFRIWFFWKKQAIFMLFLIIGLTMFYAYTVTPVFESNASIIVLPKTNEGEVISSSLDVNKVIPVSAKDVFNEAEILTSNSVLRKTVKSFSTQGINLSDNKKSLLKLIITPFKNTAFGLMHLLRLTPADSSPIETEITNLKSALSVEVVPESDMLYISIHGEIPNRTTEVLKRVLSAYLQQRDNVFNKEGGLNFYEQQASTYKSKLEIAEDKLKEFQKKENIVNILVQNQNNINLLTKLNNDLELLQISYHEGASKIDLLKRNISANTSGTVDLTKEMRKIPAIVELEKGIVPILIKRSTISTTFTKESREYIAISNQVDMLHTEIKREINKAIKTDELELASMEAKIKSLRNAIASLTKKATDFNQKDKTLTELKRQVELYKNSFLLYSGKTENSRILRDKSNHDLANVSISSPPTVPEQPVSPKRLLMLILSTLVGIFTALCTPFILESIDNKIKTVDDVEKLLELPVICSFSEIQNM